MVRNHQEKLRETAKGARRRLLGTDGMRYRYCLLGGDAGAGRVFVELHQAEDWQYTLRDSPDAAEPGPLEGPDAGDDAKPLVPTMESRHRLTEHGLVPTMEPRHRLTEHGHELGWGYYSVEELPQLITWLEEGCDGEQELADELVEAFSPALSALSALPPDASAFEACPLCCGSTWKSPLVSHGRLWLL